MSGQKAGFRGLSIAPRVGVGVITDGKLVNFTSVYPSGATQFVGGELTIDFNRLILETPSGPKRRSGQMGQLALIYYWGNASDTFSQDDLPLDGSPLKGLLKFSSKREANSHFFLAEWRWPSNAPVYQSAHWKVIHPQFGLGAGGFHISTEITQGDQPPTEKSATAFIVTGSTQVHVFQMNYNGFELSLTAAVRIFAGMAFGMSGEGGLSFAWDRTTAR